MFESGMTIAIFKGGSLDGIQREVGDPPPVIEEPAKLDDGRPGVAFYQRSSLNGAPLLDQHGRAVYAYVKTTRMRV